MHGVIVRRIHGSQFEKRKRTSELPYPLLAKKYGTFGRQLYGEGERHEQRRKDGEPATDFPT